jgi:transposase
MKLIKSAKKDNTTGKSSSFLLKGKQQMKTEVDSGNNSAQVTRILNTPDPEVTETTARRKFTTAYKLRILREADACSEPGQTGELLRREGLYSSHLATWRKQRRMAICEAVSPKKRGAKTKEKNPLAVQVAHLEKQNRILQAKLHKAELIIEAQKKISEILSLDQSLSDNEENKS